MKQLVLIGLGLFLVASSASAQIYYKKVIYVFNYSIEDENHLMTRRGEIYMGCMGRELVVVKPLGQAEIRWGTDKVGLTKQVATKGDVTGAYEEGNRVWIHPPRYGFFSILEYSPFPDIRFPVEQHRTWNRSLSLGPHWANDTYHIKGDDVLKFAYTNRGETTFDYGHQLMKCWQIEAKSTNLMHNTSFEGLFNAEYGFVKMTFRNVDKSVMRFELVRTEPFPASVFGVP